jgi:hypothetical protein
VAAPLEAMSNELRSIPALRDDIQDLRLRIEELTERINELLKRPAEPNSARRPDENQTPPPTPELEPETAAWKTEDADVL